MVVVVVVSVLYYDYYRTLIGNPMLVVEPTGQHGRWLCNLQNWLKPAGAYHFAAIGAIARCTVFYTYTLIELQSRCRMLLRTTTYCDII